MADMAKFELFCSLNWISCILKTADKDQWSRVIDTSIENNELSFEAINSLCHPLLYVTCYTSITKDTIADSSFWPLIQALAKRGLYLEDPRSELGCINHTILSSNDPFIEEVHVELIKGLMTVFMTIHSPITCIIKSIRQVSSLTASKELPTNIEEGLLLWVNKVSRVSLVNILHHNDITTNDIVQRRRIQLKVLQERKVIPKVTYDSLIDGRAIAATLIYYTKKLTWADFKFTNNMLTAHESLHNLKIIKSFCDRDIPSPSCHIEPVIWYNHYNVIKSNVYVFLSLLYHTLTTNTSLSSLIPEPSVTSVNECYNCQKTKCDCLNGSPALSNTRETIYLHITTQEDTSTSSSSMTSIFKDHVKSITTDNKGHQEKDETLIDRQEKIKIKIETRDKERKKSIKEKRKASHEQELSPTVKTNIKLIKNALCYVCLAGDANISLKQRVLSELDLCSLNHFMILFRDNIGLKFKGVYSYYNERQYHKVYGIGPKSVTVSMLDRLFKYNCGMKSFQCVPSRSFTLSVDGFTIHNHYWTNNKKRDIKSQLTL